MVGSRLMCVCLVVLLICASATAQDACFQSKQACFADSGLSSSDPTVACPLLSGLKTCLDNAACTSSDVLGDAIISTAFARLKELCQDNLCLSPYRTCLSCWDLFGENLAHFQLVANGMAVCQGVAMASYYCPPNLASNCQLVGLTSLANVMKELSNPMVYNTQFCQTNAASCVMPSLQCLPSTFVNFAEGGQDVFRTCTNETVARNCLDIVASTCPNSFEYDFVTKLGPEIVAVCDAFSFTEAQRCFASVSPSQADVSAAVCGDDSIKGCLENALQLPSTAEDQAEMIALLNALTASCLPPEPVPVCEPDLRECFDQFCVLFPNTCNNGSISEESDNEKKCIAAEYTLTCAVANLSPCDHGELNRDVVAGLTTAKKLVIYYRQHCGEVQGMDLITSIN